MRHNIRNRLRRMERAIAGKTRIPLLGSGDWTKDIPREPGVYAIWDRKSCEPVYVGETSGLKGRMTRDISYVGKHTFRKKAASVLKVDPNESTTLTRKMAKRYEVSYVAVELGRAELEEYLVRGVSIRIRMRQRGSPTWRQWKL